MPHIAITNGLPGIRGLMAERPDTAAPLNALADALSRGPSPLSRGKREPIAPSVSETAETPRHVSGLGTELPGEPGHHEESGRRITAHGYAPIV
ncbi:hypothetical protein [Streptomyces sp. TE33382]